MSTIQLIKKVQLHPVLYNVNHPDYVRKVVKDNTWTKISHELGFKDGADAKVAWQKLRNCHRDALRRRERELKSHTAQPRRRWRYEPEMEFLLQYMNKGTDGNQGNDVSQETPEEFEVAIVKNETEPDDQLYFNPENEVKKLYFNPENEAKKKEEGQVPSSDELYHFFMSMFEITKNLPMTKQIRIKRKVFEVVTEAQEEALKADSFNDE